MCGWEQELAREFRPSADTHLTVDLVVGVPLAQMEEVKARLNMDANIRGWGLPSSVLQLIKVASTTSPQVAMRPSSPSSLRPARACACSLAACLVPKP